MRAVLFANGDLDTTPLLKETDLVIAADGGAKHCLRLGIWPVYVVGDQDSLSTHELETLRSAGAHLIRYPRKKDFTDLELALMHIDKLKREEGLPIDEVLIYGALGKRWDQTIANLLLAGTSTFAAIRLITGQQEFFFVHSGETLKIHGAPGDTVSLIPLGGSASGVTTCCLEYQLQDEELVFGSTRGISNVLKDDPAVVAVKNGLLAVLVIHLPSISDQEENYES